MNDLTYVDVPLSWKAIHSHNEGEEWEPEELQHQL